MIPTIPGYHGDDPTDARLAVFPMLAALLEPFLSNTCAWVLFVLGTLLFQGVV